MTLGHRRINSYKHCLLFPHFDVYKARNTTCEEYEIAFRLDSLSLLQIKKSQSCKEVSVSVVIINK